MNTTVGRITHLGTAKGQRMPETREQFNRMGDLYEQALGEKDKEMARLKKRINKLEQKIQQLKETP